MNDLTPKETEVVDCFIRKLKQLRTDKSGRPQLVTVMILPQDYTALFWIGQPAGTTPGKNRGY